MAKGVKTGGRKPGSVNKTTQEFRHTVQALLDENRSNVSLWLSMVAQGHGDVKPAPEKALDLLHKLAEFAAPKLGRTEHVGDGGGEIKTVSRIELVGLTK